MKFQSHPSGTPMEMEGNYKTIAIRLENQKNQHYTVFQSQNKQTF